MLINLSKYARAMKMIRRGHNLKRIRVSYSQTGEDRILQNQFAHQKKGTYVEIGAFDPIKHSNTYAFYLSGWSGILVEPDPTRVPLFQRHRPRDEFVGCAVSSEEGTVNMLLADKCSAIVGDQDSDNVVTLPSRRLSSIFNDSRLIGQSQCIDFMTVDCEEADLVVLQSNDWGRFRPRCVVVEENPLINNNECRLFLEGLGYHYIAQTLLSSIYVLNEEVSILASAAHG